MSTTKEQNTLEEIVRLLEDIRTNTHDIQANTHCMKEDLRTIVQAFASRLNDSEATLERIAVALETDAETGGSGA